MDRLPPPSLTVASRPPSALTASPMWHVSSAPHCSASVVAPKGSRFSLQRRGDEGAEETDSLCDCPKELPSAAGRIWTLLREGVGSLSSATALGENESRGNKSTDTRVGSGAFPPSNHCLHRTHSLEAGRSLLCAYGVPPVRAHT